MSRQERVSINSPLALSGGAPNAPSTSALSISPSRALLLPSSSVSCLFCSLYPIYSFLLCSFCPFSSLYYSIQCRQRACTGQHLSPCNSMAVRPLWSCRLSSPDQRGSSPSSPINEHLSVVTRLDKSHDLRGAVFWSDLNLPLGSLLERNKTLGFPLARTAGLALRG